MTMELSILLRQTIHRVLEIIFRLIFAQFFLEIYETKLYGIHSEVHFINLSFNN